MFFDGKIKSRVVTGAGKKRDADPKNFLEHTRKQREDRALDKIKFNSANLIQRVYRGILSREKNRLIFLNDFDKKVSDVQKLKALLATKGSNDVVFVVTFPIK